MRIHIVIKPNNGDRVRFGYYDSIGEALHTASNLGRHQMFSGKVWVEEIPTMTECVIAGYPEGTPRVYEIS